MTPRINNEVFADYLKCQYKAYLKLKGRTGQKTEYEKLQNRLLQEYRTKALEHFLSSKYKNEAFLSKITLSKLVGNRDVHKYINNVTRLWFSGM
jgi:hypothetical protein